MRRAAVFPFAATCFFVSGAAALLYEVVWTRHLGGVFGHTVHAITTVLACYMAGLALGSVVAGRRADRLRAPLRTYAALEAAIGLYCALTPLLFRAVDAIYLSLYAALRPGALGAGVLHFALAALVLLPPTALMGATLPVLCRAVVDGRAVPASQAGTLYAVNTWGSVAGTAATGFLLLPAIGMSATVWLGVALNLGVAALALAASRRLATAPAAAPADPAAPLPSFEAPSRLQAAVALSGIGVAGGASMGYEIAWTRALGLTLGSSTYAFTAMLATFLAGLALGALVAARLLRRRALGIAAFGAVEIAIAIAGVLLLPAFGRLPEALLFTLGEVGVHHRSVLAVQFAFSFALMIGPTLLIGMTFPLVVAGLDTRAGAVGRSVGRVYGANTVGTIAGSMLAGFVLIPAVGIQSTVRLAALANLVVGLATIAVAVRRRGVALGAGLGAVAAFAVAVVALPPWDPKMMTTGVPVYAAEMVKGGVQAVKDSQRHRELLLYREGISTTVAVVRSPTAISLSVNGKTDASNTRDMATQLLLGHMGALLHPEARNALVIGLASGITAGAVAQHPFDAIDVAEIEPAMVEACRFFETENRKVLADPRVRVLEGDGRQILASAARRYDVIISEPSNPWIAGVANLFTREFYESARRKLADDGVMVQWLQTYSISSDDMRMVVRTFQGVFPHVSVWTGSLGDVLLVATPGPVRLDLDTIRERVARSPGVRADFERFGWGGENLVFRFLLGEEDVRRYAEGARVNTDDLPYLEFSAPLALYTGSAFDNKAVLRSFQTVDRPVLAGVEPERVVGPAARLFAARLHWSEGRLEDADLEFRRAGPAGALEPALRIERARLALLLARFDEAWAEIAALAASRPDDPRVRRLQRTVAALADPATEARLQKVMVPLPARWFADPPLLAELVLNLGIERDDREVIAAATEQLEAALRLNPGHVATLGNYGIALAYSGRTEAAHATFRRALEIEPRDAKMHFNLGTLHERAGDPAGAVRWYAEAARLAPAWAPPRQRLVALGGAPR